MADFKQAFKITIIGNEGGYNPGIDEHQTYMGIDRGANPGWSGWKIIDTVKRNFPNASIQKINVLLSQNAMLQASILEFYKTNYWEAVKLDDVDDQQLANNLFDCAVNQGEGLARLFMQVACNDIITTTKSPIMLLVVDRMIGPATLVAVNALPPAMLNGEINARRETSYRKDSGFADWGNVWLKRLKQYI
jgi:lysozyme family protein